MENFKQLLKCRLENFAIILYSLSKRVMRNLCKNVMCFLKQQVFCDENITAFTEVSNDVYFM